MDWKSYTNNRLIQKFDGYFVIVPEGYLGSKTMPLFCDVCSIRFCSVEDEKSYDEFECCSSCADTWAYSKKSEWKNGWRPSKEQVENSIERRIFVNQTIRFE